MKTPITIPDDFSGLTFPTPSAPLVHHGLGPTTDWATFLDSVAWQTVHYLRNRGTDHYRHHPDEKAFSF